MDYNIEGNIFKNAQLKILEFGSQNGCTVQFHISGSEGSDLSASMVVTNEVPPIDRTDEAIYLWLLEQLKQYEV